MDDDDRRRLLAFVKQAMDRFDAVVLAYCLMGNHYHFVLQTRRANLSLVMRHINAKFSQAFNRRHGLVGHVFQSRYKAILVDSDAYLMALCRYVELNPVRAGLVAAPSDWAWSSYAAHTGLDASPAWLDVDVLHGHLLRRNVDSAEDRSRAQALYEQLVLDGRDDHLWDRSLRDRIYLGEEEFVARVRAQVESATSSAPKPPRKSSRGVDRQAGFSAQDETAWRMHVESGLCMSEIACELNLSLSRVSRLIARFENAGRLRGEI